MYGLMNLRLLPGNGGEGLGGTGGGGGNHHSLCEELQREPKWIGFTFDKNTQTAPESSDDSAGLIIQLFIPRIKAALRWEAWRAMGGIWSWEMLRMVAQGLRQPSASASSPAPGRVLVCLSACLSVCVQKCLHKFPQRIGFHRSSAMLKLSLPWLKAFGSEQYFLIA